MGDNPTSADAPVLTDLTVTADIIPQFSHDQSLPDIAQVTIVAWFTERHSQRTIENALGPDENETGNHSFGGLLMEGEGDNATYMGAVLSGWKECTPLDPDGTERTMANIDTTADSHRWRLQLRTPPSGMRMPETVTATTTVLLPSPPLVAGWRYEISVPRLPTSSNANGVAATPVGFPDLPGTKIPAPPIGTLLTQRAGFVWENDDDPLYDVEYVLKKTRV